MLKKEVSLFGIKISQLGLRETVDLVIESAFKRSELKVYCCTLNDLVAANEDKKIGKMLKRGDLRTADGMPLVWTLRRKTGKGERVYGPDLMEKIFLSDKQRKLKHFFLGSTNENLEKIQKRLVREFEYKPENLGSYSPDFKKNFNQSDFEKYAGVIKIHQPNIVWVGTGAEKQIEMSDRLSRMVKGVVWVTVGAAFDFFAGTKKQAPVWIQRTGGEWFFRLATEPKRLGPRYLKILIFLGKKLFRDNDAGN